MIFSTFVFTAFLAVASAQLNGSGSVVPPLPQPTSSGSVAPPFPDPASPSTSTASTITQTNTPITYITPTTYIPSAAATSTANTTTTTSTLPSCIRGYTLTTITLNATTITRAVHCTPPVPSTPVGPTFTFTTPTTYIPSTMATVTFVPRPSGSGSPVPSGNGNGNGNGTVTTVIPGAKTSTAPIVPVGPTTALAAPLTGAAATAIHMSSPFAAFVVVAAGLLLL